MNDPPHDEDRLERDRDRTTEAHWRAAEEAAEAAPGQKTPEGSEIPVPKRNDDVAPPEKKP